MFRDEIEKKIIISRSQARTNQADFHENSQDREFSLTLRRNIEEDSMPLPLLFVHIAGLVREIEGRTDNKDDI